MAGWWSRHGVGDLAIDLGTANTVIYQRGRGIVLDEPSVVAIDRRSERLIAAGHRAKEMLGRTPDHVEAVRPLKDGVVSDAEITERMLRYFVEQVGPSKIVRPRIVICVRARSPGGAQSLEDSALRSGARRVYIIEEAMAAALGAGCRSTSPAHLVVDIGGGTTDVAVIVSAGS